ncbi:hypothetical protein ACLKA6_012291 [Drosophila palustris]
MPPAAQEMPPAAQDMPPAAQDTPPAAQDFQPVCLFGDWGLCLCKVLIFKVMIQTIWKNGSSIWGTAAPYLVPKMQSSDCKVLRRIFGDYPFARNDDIMRDLKVLSVF